MIKQLQQRPIFIIYITAIIPIQTGTRTTVQNQYHDALRERNQNDGLHVSAGVRCWHSDNMLQDTWSVGETMTGLEGLNVLAMISVVDNL
jgi:hypothetical protein